MAPISRILVSAGELSGDEHAAEVVKALRAQNPALTFRGMGGENLENAGMEIVVDSRKSASVMGFGPVVRSINKIFHSLNTMKELVRNWKPDVLILVDYPDFNLRLAKFAKSQGVKVFYFIPPKMWAWRAGRIKFFHRDIDAVGLIFSFEKKFFAAHGYNRATFLGHPYVETLGNARWGETERAAFFTRHKLESSKPLLAVLPGSRWMEIERHLDCCLGAMRELQNRHPTLQLAIGVAPTIDAEKLRAKIPSDMRITIVASDTIELMRAADAGLIKSGTSNLQAAFLNLPQMMFYLAPKFSQFIVYNFVKIKEYSLPNIVRPHSIFEVTGPDVTRPVLVKELEALLFDAQKRAEIKKNYLEIVANLTQYDQNPVFAGTKSAYERFARLVLQMAA
jgi:lipid-A-disaccharide synthase